MPRVGVRPHALLEVGEDRGQGFAGLHDHVGEQEAHQDSVALRYVTADPKTSGLLTAQHCLGLHHLRGHVLESDRHLEHRGPKLGGELVDHRGHVHRLDHRAAHPSHLEEIEHQQREDLQLVDEAARLIDDSHAVGIPVGAYAQVLPPHFHEGQRRIDVGPDRLGADTTEQRVPLVMKLRHGRATATDELSNIPVPRAVHALMDDPQACFLDRVDVDHASDLRVIRRARVVGRDQVTNSPVVDLRHVVGQAVDSRFELSDHLGRRRAAGLRLVLDTIELVRVMAGGDHRRAGRLAVDHRPGGDLGRRGTIEDQGPHAVGREYVSDRSSEVLGREAAVVANDRERVVRARPHVLGGALGNPTHVRVGEIVGDHTAPAVGAEFDLVRHHSHRSKVSCRGPREIEDFVG